MECVRAGWWRWSCSWRHCRPVPPESPWRTCRAARDAGGGRQAAEPVALSRRTDRAGGPGRARAGRPDTRGARRPGAGLSPVPRRSAGHRRCRRAARARSRSGSPTRVSQRPPSSLRIDGADWPIFRRAFPEGWVGLGVNALDWSASTHYVVFVRPAEGGSVAVQAIDPGHWRIDDRRAMGSARPPTSRCRSTACPTSSGAPPCCKPAHDQRHATALAHGRVWKTHVASSRTPDQVAIAFGHDPAAKPGLDLADRAGRRPRPRSRLASGRGLAPIRVVRGDSHLVESPDLLNDPTIRRHRVAATDLEPDTAYAYASATARPEAGRPGGRSGPRPRGPERSSSSIWATPSAASKRGASCSDAPTRAIRTSAFLLLAGDLVDRGNERTNWDHFFLRAAGVFERLPLMPCVGNHEYLDQGPRLYRAFFDLPANGPTGIDPDLVYSFEYADAFVAVLDSTLAIADPRHARRPGRVARRGAGPDPRHLEVRDVPPPGLRLAPDPREPRLARRLGARLRQAPRRPRAPGPRSRLPADLPPARRPPRRLDRPRGRRTSSRSRATSTTTSDPRDETAVGLTEPLDLSDDRHRGAREPAHLSRLGRRGPRGRPPRRSRSRGRV